MQIHVVLLYLAKFSFALHKSVELANGYFRVRNVKTLCFLSGSNDMDIRFAKEVNKQSITLQSVNDESKSALKSCQRPIYTHTGIVLNSNYPSYKDILVNADSNIFDSNHVWLIFQDNSTEIDSIFSNINLSVNADIVIAIHTDSGYTLYDIFNYGKIQGGHLQKEIIGSWRKDRGLILNKTFKYVRRFDYQKLALRLMIVYQGKPEDFRPEIILERDLASGISIVTQTSGMILHEVASIHNINFNYSICDRWVGDYKRESPNAVTNSLFFNQIDITPTLRFLPSHMDYYDVIHQHITYAEGRYFYRIPTTGVGKYENQFLTPFTRDVWFSVLGIITLCGLGLFLGARQERRPMSGHYAFFSVIALSCQQFFEDIDDSVVKKSSAGRKLSILVTGISCVLMFNYYTSSVVSWLLNGPPPSINSLWELMDSPLEPIFEDVGYTCSWLQLPDYYYNKKNSRAEDILKKRIKKKGNLILTSPMKGVEMVRTGAFAFHCDANSAYKYIAKTFTQKELCDLDSLPSFEKALLYTAVQKNSPYREFFIWSYARIYEQGIMKVIQSRTYPRVMKCEGSTPRALALGGAAPAFVMLGIGYVTGTFIMLIERIMKAKEDKKISKSN